MDLSKTLWYKITDKLTRKISGFLDYCKIPIHICPPHIWIYQIKSDEKIYGRFRKRYKCVYNPRRWGGYFWELKLGVGDSHFIKDLLVKSF